MESLSKMLIDALRADATRHNKGEFQDLGCGFHLVDDYRSRHPNLPPDRNVAVAHTFWDSWIDQVQHGFAQTLYAGIEPDAWPAIAKEIADNLESGTPIENAVVLRHFDRSAK